MQFKSSLALCAAVLAAVTEGRIAFTTLPSSVTAGSPVQLAWSGSDGTPVTITLKRGSSNNLQTVSLITGNASGNSYTWTPSSDVQNGSDYALQITQDDTDINYTGLFTISGGQSAAQSTLSAPSSTSASSYPTASANMTTTAAPYGTAPASAGATGTGANANRNTTFSTATLSATGSSSSGAATTVTGEGVATSATSASSSPSASSTGKSGAAVNIASNFGLLLAGFAAVVYLG